jgi:hypothetical protein
MDAVIVVDLHRRKRVRKARAPAAVLQETLAKLGTLLASE